MKLVEILNKIAFKAGLCQRCFINLVRYGALEYFCNYRIHSGKTVTVV